MESSKFCEFFNLKVNKEDRSAYINLLLVSALTEDINDKNYKDLRDKFSLKMMHANVEMKQLLIYLNAFDDVVVENIIREEPLEKKSSTVWKKRP